MNRRLGLLFACSLIVAAPLASCGGGAEVTGQWPTPAPTPTPPSPSPSPPAGTPTLTRTTFVSGLSNPWDMAFLPDGTMFFTEKCNGLSVRLPNGTINRLLGMNGTSGYASTAADLFCEGQSGMHGVAIDPDFANNRYVYVYSTSSLRTNPRTNRVLRLVVAPDFASVSGRTDIVTDIAFKDQANAVGGAGAHSGGRIRFGPDGYLYVTTGDNHNATLPQDPHRLGGKVLRIDRNGAAHIKAAMLGPGETVPVCNATRRITGTTPSVSSSVLAPIRINAVIGKVSGIGRLNYALLQSAHRWLVVAPEEPASLPAGRSSTPRCGGLDVTAPCQLRPRIDSCSDLKKY